MGMRAGQLVGFSIGLAGLLALPSGARADEEIAARGAELIETIDPPEGFIDDPFTFDGAGGRLLYVNADAAKRAEIHVYDPAQESRLSRVDISRFTRSPAKVEFALGGDHFFVMERASDEGPATAALINSSGKVVRKFGPADDIVHTIYDGHEAVSLYQRSRARRRGEPSIRHQVEVFDLERGRRIGKKTVLLTDPQGHSKKHDFKIVYWSDGYTRAVGIKGGSWDAQSDKRSPDYQAWYDLPTRTFLKRETIKNVVAHTKRMRLLSGHSNQPSFLKVKDDLSGVVWISGNDARRVRLKEEFQKYDHTSLRQQRARDGTLYFTLTVDPVNPDAVARKRADRPWLDLYVLAPGKSRAVRKARILPPSKRKLSWQATGSYWAVLPHHIGFGRGGGRLLLFKL